jgi:Uma2 family endonuclease
MRNAPKERGIEPEECYAVGAAKESPDLAVEVIWTHGGLDKREVYRGLGVREVWIWTKEALKAYELRGNAYLRFLRAASFRVSRRPSFAVFSIVRLRRRPCERCGRRSGPKGALHNCHPEMLR